MSEREIQVYSYTLNIQSIKMKVKFPCKMKLEYAGEVLTSEVGQNDSGKFIFNQQVTLKEDTDRTYFEIIANIATEKGAKYIAGIIKLAQSQLVHQEGEMMVINLSKCLDSQACCQLRVDQVSTEKIMKKVPIEKVMVAKNREFHQEFSPKKFLEVPKNFTGSRSQYQFPLTNSRQVNPVKTKEQGYQSIYERPRSPVNNFRKTNAAATYIERNVPEFGVIDSSNRDKLIEAEVYKQSYQKLKEKYKRQAETAKHELNKRIALQNNENNFKLEIMRLKLRCEEQEKTISDKNAKLKEMQLQLAGLQKKQLDLNYLREEASNKDHTIRMLQDTIRTLNKDNEDLKNLNHERFESEQQKIRELRNEVDSGRQRYEAKIGELQKELRLKMEILNQKDIQIRVKEERMQRQQRLVDELEKLSQSKSYQHERALQTQQNQWKAKMEESKNMIEKLEKEKAKLEAELQSSRAEQDKIKTYVIKIEYDKKILTQETDSMKTELSEIKVLRQKYQEIVREHRLLTEDKNHLQKQFEKTLQNKDANLTDLTKQYKQQVEHYRKLHKEVEEKMRNSQNKTLQLENLLEQKKNQAEKLRKNNDSLTKEGNDLKEKEKNLKRSLKLKQQQIASITAQFESSRYKTKSGDQLSRYEIENLRQELGKCKREFETQIMKSAQQTEKLANLTSEYNRAKLQLQQVNDQNEKDSSNYREKIASLENYNKQYEKRIDQCNSLIATLRNNDKDSQMKIQKFQLQGLKTNEKIEKQQKDIRMLEDKIAQNENQIKAKLTEINNLQFSRQNMEKKLQESEEKLNAVKNSLNTMTGEKNKNDKIIELLNRDIAEFKQEADKQSKLIQAKEKLEEDIRAELKKSKEQYLKLQMKNTALKKEYDRFKEHLSETLAATFSQLPLGASDLKASSVSIELNGKKSDTFDSGSYNAQILNKINAQNKDIKVAMSKMIEHNKMLQKQVQRLSEEGMSTAARNQISEEGLNKRIEQLEDQINRLGIERDEQNIKSKGVINDLRAELEQRENTNKELILQLEELNFTVNSIKMDQQANSEHFNLKQTQYKAKIGELEEKITYLTNTLNESEISCHSFESKLAEKTTEFENEREISTKKEKQIQIIRQERKTLANIVEDGKKQRKQLLQKISELQLKLSTQIQLKQKGRSLLEDEQRKGTELKDFVANLMKQKELAIKGDLEKSQQIIALQAILMEVNREKDTQAEQIQRLRKNLDDQKQMIKKQTAQIKDLEATGSDQKGRGAKLGEKLRQKQRQLKESQQSLLRLRSEYEKVNSKLNKTISDLSTQLEQKTKQKDNKIKNLAETINELQRQKQQAQLKVTSLKTQILMLEENLFMEKQSSEVNAEQSTKLLEEIEGLKSQIKRQEDTIASQNQEMKEKQEGMFQMSGKVYQLEASLQSKEQELTEKLNLVSEDWSNKYDSMVEQYEQRIELVEKEKSYFKARLEEKQEEYRKIVAERRNNQLEDSGLRKALQEKVKRLEQQRLGLISSKNLEIQRLAEDNKGKFESLKTKEADLRRLQHQLEVARTTINKLEQSKKETEEKIKHINKVYQAELEQLKRRQANTRNLAEQMERVQWDVEREVKKTILSYTKKISVGELKEENQKIISTMKSLEDEVINAISHKFNPASN